MRVHLVGLPHNDTVRATEYCAFSQKCRRLADMLTSVGHEVIYYGGPRNEAAVAEHVIVVTDEDRTEWFGDETWTDNVFDRWDPADPCWAEMNARTIAAITDRLGPTDIIGITMGRCQQTIADAFPAHVIAEVGIGYEGPLTTTHWCVESEAWRHHLYGRYGINDGRWYDVTIPNAYDPDDFDFCPEPDDYLLYLGRMTPRKGLAVVGELAKRHRVITAGPGPERVPNAEHRGIVVGDEKRKLLASARALLVPTTYIEPFGGVAIEAMMSGTPVLTTPWGAFSETVVAGMNGWRCHTRGEFEEAIDLIGRRAGGNWRRKFLEQARHTYSTATVARRYDRWLNRLATLYDRGWYQ